MLSKKDLSFNDKKVVSFKQVKKASNWLISPLFEVVKKEIEQVNKTESLPQETEQNKALSKKYKMTLQVDKDIAFLPVKKILYTLTQAGVQEINFAVIKVKAEDKYHLL